MITNTFKLSSQTGIYDEQTELSEQDYSEIVNLFSYTYELHHYPADEELIFTCEIHNGSSLFVDLLNNTDPELTTGDFFHNVF